MTDLLKSSKPPEECRTKVLMADGVEGLRTVEEENVEWCGAPFKDFSETAEKEKRGGKGIKVVFGNCLRIHGLSTESIFEDHQQESTNETHPMAAARIRVRRSWH